VGEGEDAAGQDGPQLILLKPPLLLSALRHLLL
jgi:hypothetical protein